MRIRRVIIGIQNNINTYTVIHRVKIIMNYNFVLQHTNAK